MVDRGLRRSFDPGGRARGARGVRGGVALEGRGEAGDRRDLRSLPTFTVDPASARDFDDAISAAAARTTARGGSGCTSPTCPPTCAPGSLIDREAYRRGTSVYVPGAVEPMLPEALSNDACSLVPGPGSPGGHDRDRARRATASAAARSTAR